MKFDKNLLQRTTDYFVVHARELSSRGSSFLILMLGMLLQASHTTLLMYHVSAFESNFVKGLVAFGIGIFVSGALAIFTLKSDGKNRDINHIINVFFYFEIFTNIFYYWNSLIFSVGFDNATTQQWLYLIIAMPFSYIMPFTIKKFAGAIRTEESLDFGKIDIIPTEEPKKDIIDVGQITEDMTEEQVKDLFNTLIKEKLSESENKIKELEEELKTIKSESTSIANGLKNYATVGSNMTVSVNDQRGNIKIVAINSDNEDNQTDISMENLTDEESETDEENK